MISLDTWESVPGTFTFPGFYDWLASQMSPSGKFVEIGVDHGQSMLYMAARWEGRKFGVDVSLGRVSQKTREALPFVGWIEKPSVQAAQGFADNELEAVFIDGDHSYDGVRADIAAWAPKVRSGGIIAGHDYTLEHFEGVVRAVTEAFPSHELYVEKVLWQKCDKGCFGSEWHGHLVEAGENTFQLPCWWVRKA